LVIDIHHLPRHGGESVDIGCAGGLDIADTGTALVRNHLITDADGKALRALGAVLKALGALLAAA
jgi:hypothetical protein